MYTRPVKALLFGELEGSRKVGRPLLRYKDTCKMALQRGKVLNEWIAVVNDRDKWKALIQNVCKEPNQKRKADYEDRNVTNANCNSLYMLVTIIISISDNKRQIYKNSPSQDSNHPDDLFRSRYVVTVGFKPFSYH